MNAKRMFSNVAITLGLIISICYLSSCSKGAIVDKLVEKTAEEANKHCPMVVDAGTRLDSITHPEKATLGYYYTLINLEKDSLTFGPEMLEGTLIEAVKLTPELEPMRKLEVSFKYVYFDKNGELAFEIDVTPEKYK